MLVLNQVTEVRWNPANKKYYENKGYEFTKNGDIFTVKIEDLAQSSGYRIKIICDSCGDIIEKRFASYYKSIENSKKIKTPHKDYCKICSNKYKNKWNKKSDEQFKRDVYNAVGNEYSIIEKYINSKTKIKIKHNECGNTFKMSPNGFLAGHRCHKCKGGVKNTHDEFYLKFYKLVKDEYTLLDKYINSSSKILVRHNICNHEWKVEPGSFLQGSRCPKCYGTIKKTTKQFKQEVFEKVNNEYSVIGEYINANTKISMRHNLCNCKYEVTPSGFINKGRRCPNCNTKKKKTNNQFLEEVFNLVGNEYEVLDEYKNAKNKVLIKHNDCGYEWTILPNNFIKGKRCPKCAGNAHKTTKIFKKEIFDLVSNEYKVIGEYLNTDTPILMKHSVCGNEFKMIPDVFLRGSRCPKCAIENRALLRTKTTEDFRKEVKELTNGEYELIGEYINCREKVKLKHNLCGSIYEQSPSDFLSGCRCAICFESKGEQAVRHWLENNHIKFEVQKEFNGLIGLGGGLLRYDFYLPNHNLLIEYQGEFHDCNGGKGTGYVKEVFPKQQEHDRRKKEYAEKNGIKLLEIWYWDFDNIEKILEKELYNLIPQSIQ